MTGGEQATAALGQGGATHQGGGADRTYPVPRRRVKWEGKQIRGSAAAWPVPSLLRTSRPQRRWMLSVCMPAEHKRMDAWRERSPGLKGVPPPRPPGAACGVRPPPSRSQPFWELVGLRPPRISEMPKPWACDRSPETALRHAPDKPITAPYHTRDSSARSARLADIDSVFEGCTLASPHTYVHTYARRSLRSK